MTVRSGGTILPQGRFTAPLGVVTQPQAVTCPLQGRIFPHQSSPSLLLLTRVVFNTREQTLLAVCQTLFEWENHWDAFFWIFMLFLGVFLGITKTRERATASFLAWKSPCGFLIMANVGGRVLELESFPQET